MAKVWDDFVNGTDFGIFVDGTLVAAATDNQMQGTTNMVNVSNKDSGRSNVYRPGRTDDTSSGTANLTYEAGFSFWDLKALQNNGTEVVLKYSNDETGDDFWEQSAYISELSRTDPDDEQSTMNYSFQHSGDGEIKEVPA